MARNDQPFLTKDYNTDQFTDPVYGFTVYDDGSSTYTQPQTGLVYKKIRGKAGESYPGYVSHSITLVLSGGYTIEDGVTFYTTEDGLSVYIPEP